MSYILISQFQKCDSICHLESKKEMEEVRQINLLATTQKVTLTFESNGEKSETHRVRVKQYLKNTEYYCSFE